jgi:ribonuclease P protein component
MDFVLVWPQRQVVMYSLVEEQKVESDSRFQLVQNKKNSDKIRTLKRRSDFLALRTEGRKVRPSRWLLMSYKPNNLGHVRCGWTIPKKVGNAVIRNKLKRWCRESVRSLKSKYLQRGLDLNVVIYEANDDLFRTIKFDEFKNIFERGLRGLA